MEKVIHEKPCSKQNTMEEEDQLNETPFLAYIRRRIKNFLHQKF